MEISLFKYRKLDEYAIQNIVNNSIWLSTIDKLNDPFDTAYFFLENLDIIEGGLLPPIKLNNKKQRLLEKISNFGICSFSFEYDIEKLWSHYADSHLGICIEYIFKKNEVYTKKIKKSLSFFSSNIDNFDILPVEYLVTYDFLEHKKKSSTIENHFDFFVPEIFDNFYEINNDKMDLKLLKSLSFIKRKCWEEEKEVRIFKEFKDKQKYGLELCNQKILSITLGINFQKNNEENKKRLKKLLDYSEKNNIKIYKMKLYYNTMTGLNFFREETNKKDILNKLM